MLFSRQRGKDDATMNPGFSFLTGTIATPPLVLLLSPSDFSFPADMIPWLYVCHPERSEGSYYIG